MELEINKASEYWWNGLTNFEKQEFRNKFNKVFFKDSEITDLYKLFLKEKKQKTKGDFNYEKIDNFLGRQNNITKDFCLVTTNKEVIEAYITLVDGNNDWKKQYFTNTSFK